MSNDKHKALRDAITMKELLEPTCRSGDVGVDVAELRALLADHDRMRSALERIVDDESCDYETIFRIADVVLREDEQ